MATHSQPLVDAVLFVALAWLGRPTVLWLSGRLQRRVLPEHYRRRQASRRLRDMLARQEGLPEEQLPLIEALVEALGFEHAGLYTREPGQGRLHWVTGTRPPTHQTLALESVEQGLALVEGYTRGLALAIRDRKVGYLVLAERSPGRALGKAERRLLSQGCEQLAMSLENQWLGRALIDERLATSRADEDREVQERVNAVVSHQLKTPLLLGQSMLSDARQAIADRSRVARRLDKIATALGRFERNVIQNLDRHRIELGPYELEVEPTSLSGLVGRCVDEVRYALGKRGARARVEVPAEARVLANPSRLEIVFDNLIGNALKVLPSGGTLTVTAERVGERVRIDVSNDGPAIPPHRLEGLFGAQVPNPEDPTSTGIGLAICRDYMRAMGGSIDLHANGPEGVTFRLELRGVAGGFYPC